MDANQSDPASESASLAEEVFAEYLMRLQSGEDLRFASLCEKYPQLTSRLEVLRDNWERVASLIGRLGLGGSLATRIREQYGAEADPLILLHAEEEEERGDDISSEVIDRLSERKGAFGRYRLKGELARGGMGVILRVWDEDLRRSLAMKVVLEDGVVPGKTGAPRIPPRRLARFLEEAQVTSQLDHPGIVPVHELGLDSEGRVYFTMKLVRGRTLKEILDLAREEKEGWTKMRVLVLLIKICEAMSYAHAKRVIHRDLKPANIMVGRYGEVFVMDWGLARLLDRDDPRGDRVAESTATSSIHSERRDHEAEEADSPIKTSDGDVMGTPPYMSPEQAMGQLSTMGPQSDVYAVGAMFYHLLAGHMPYVPEGAVLNNFAVWNRVQEGPPASLHVEAPNASAEIAAICDKAMAREPEERYASMHELARDLTAYLDGRVVRAYQTGVWAETKKWVKRNPGLARSLVALIVLLAIGLTTSLVLWARTVREKDNVMRLSALQDLEDLRARADALWPATPDLLSEYDMWLEDAEELVAGLDSTPGRDDVDHEERLENLRARARPQTAAELEADRPPHSWEREVELLGRKASALRQAEAVRSGEAEFEPYPLDTESIPRIAAALTEQIWHMVDPDRSIYGQEPEGLAYARFARDCAEDDEVCIASQRLAWALFANGLDEQALAASEEALNHASETEAEAYDADRRRLVAAVADARAGGIRRIIAELEARLDVLRVEGEQRHDWRFDREHDRWWHYQLEKLTEEIRSFSDPETGLLTGISPAYGWGIARRRAFASTIEEHSLEGSEARRRWADARSRIAELDVYRDLDLTAQVGLLPLGQDPESQLWEFWHLQTGKEPTRGPDGRWIVTEETGLVLVLIPGGTFAMGAQGGMKDADQYDEGAEPDETPHEVELSAFFLSKYEMTQGQWARITGRDPSQYERGFAVLGHLHDRTHPVEYVSWYDCAEVLRWLGLHLPSEAQWEYAARGDTTTVFWSGDRWDDLRGVANVRDQAVVRIGMFKSLEPETWTYDDGFVLHAPVGRFRANPFGLHDVHGNVWEWCQDVYDPGFYARSPRRDPVCTAILANPLHVSRGGDFYSYPVAARCAGRQETVPELAVQMIGVRPARAIMK